MSSSVDSLLLEQIRAHGSPLFVVDAELLRRTFEEFRNAFAAEYPRSTIAYSVKTNYLPALCRRLFEMGAAPEVIAGLELDLVQKLGFLGATCVVNGPLKTDEELDLALGAGARVNVDNFAELERVARIAAKHNAPARVGLRVRPAGENWKRFGFDEEGGKLLDAAARIHAAPQLKLVGLHCHLGTGIIDLERYRAASTRLGRVAEEMIGRGLLDLEYLDLGGGFATAGARLNHFTEAQWQVPSAREYAKAVIEPLLSLLTRTGAELLVEPGRALVDDAVQMLTTVVSVEDGRIIVDAGKNLLPSVTARVHEIRRVGPSSADAQACSYDLFGPLCMGSDCLGRSVSLPQMTEGDVLAVNAAGAYSLSQSLHFIRYQPAWIVIGDGPVRVARQRESFDALFRLDDFAA